MAFEDDLDPDFLHEAPYFLTAAIVYAGALFINPVVRWGSGHGPAEKSVPVEFVAQLPAPSPNLLPQQGEGKTEAPPQKGEGEYKPEKVKEGAVDAPPKPLPKPKPAAIPSVHKKAGATIVKPKVQPKHVVNAQAILAKSLARREKLDHDKAVKAAAVEAAAEKAAEAKELAAEKAAAAKAAALARADALRKEKARKAEAARVREEQIAAAKAAKAAKKAELSQQLATMNDPDEALAADDGGGAKAKAAAPSGGGHAAGHAAAAAALADAAESPDPGDSAGSGGGDLLDAKAKGGGTGPDGEGVSWSLDGPVGSRRVLSRAVPTSPDWVGTRGLDLTVTVRFQVMSDGSVRPGAVIQKTSGFPEIDRRALDALGKWRFESVPDGGDEVWGRVTFRFTS